MRSEYRRRVHEALQAIAKLEAREGDAISASAVVLGLMTNGADRAMVREAVADGIQLMIDQGVLSPVLTKGARTTSLYTVHERFGPEEAEELFAWDGLTKVERGE
jgi:hypothetical protein